MTSPVGHSLAGWILGKPNTLNYRWLLFIFFAANAPDLDFILGAMEGQLNRYHHMASHSLSVAGLFALVCYCGVKIWGGNARHIAIVGGLAYASHLLFDAVTVDTEEPRGMQLYWPFSEEYIIAPVTFFANIQHGDTGDTLRAALHSIFSVHNFKAILLELAIFTPVLIWVKWLKRNNE
ncbi:MAG: membrane-bound metal-dependent hydrolase YbcI (DUF457 family) [Cryomorphaceae bacterium]